MCYLLSSSPITISRALYDLYINIPLHFYQSLLVTELLSCRASRGTIGTQRYQREAKIVMLVCPLLVKWKTYLLLQREDKDKT